MVRRRPEWRAGMWTKTLRRNTNLSPQLVARALKNLEQRLLVKSIKGVQNATKKLYMLHDLEPAKELTGGAWCVGSGVRGQAALRCHSTRLRRLRYAPCMGAAWSSHCTRSCWLRERQQRQLYTGIVV